MKYFYGPDTYAARQAIDELAQQEKARVRWLDKEDLLREGLSSWLDRGGGLFGQELLVVRDPSAFTKELQEDIMSVCKTGGADIIFWDRVKPDKRSALWKTLKPYAREFAPLPFPELVKWLCSISPSIDPASAAELVRRAGADRWRLLSEAKKLELFGGPVTLALVQEHVPPADGSDDIFPILDALSQGKQASAISGIETVLQKGENEFYILSMLAYQFRTLLAIRTGRQQHLHPYVVQKNSPSARRYSPEALLDTLTRILAVDVAIKQGKVDARTGLMMLVLGLSR